MLKRQLALLWSRKEMILANKQAGMLLIFPVLMMAIYQFMFKDRPGAQDMILFMIMPMVYVMVSQLLPTLVSEEAEKNNQRSLLLAGVKDWEYILASLVIPFATILVYVVFLPIFLGLKPETLGPAYLVVNVLTGLATLLFNLLIALLCETQTRAVMMSMPVMMLNMLIPMLSLSDKTIAALAPYSHMGSYIQLQQDSGKVFGDGSFLSLIVWCIALIVALLAVVRYRRRRR